MKKFVFIVVLLVAQALWSQTIFPTLAGQQLLDSLFAGYRPASVLSYNNARDLMFGSLNNVNDSVACVYTGFKVFVDPNSTTAPRTQAYNAGLNTEHTWPQSLGAFGQAKSDLHHLFPTRIDVNSDRGSFPFAEIPDQNTDRWYRLDQQQSSPPNQFRDEYSELDFNTAFEPREDHKGNVARAIFYFYTMYRSQSDQTFFLIQKDVLRVWNILDPVDAAEIQRSQAIAVVQDGKPNPFVLDTTLVRRAYFPPITGIANGNTNGLPQQITLHQNYPNPFNPSTKVEFEVPGQEWVKLTIYDQTGKEVTTLLNRRMSAGAHTVSWDGRDNRGQRVGSGVYFYQLRTTDYQQTRKMILLR